FLIAEYALMLWISAPRLGTFELDLPVVPVTLPVIGRALTGRRHDHVMTNRPTNPIPGGCP
ncbi:MAG TPA: hypothetical protein VIG75_06470, partial [Citricoccus sp.]